MCVLVAGGGVRSLRRITGTRVQKSLLRRESEEIEEERGRARKGREWRNNGGGFSLLPEDPEPGVEHRRLPASSDASTSPRPRVSSPLQYSSPELGGFPAGEEDAVPQ